MSMMLMERLSFDQAGLVLEEKEGAEGKGKSLYMKGIFITGGVRNLNERVYPINEIEKAVESVNRTLREGESVLGECDHPEELTINLDRVSHLIEGMWMDGNSGFGKLKILPTPCGHLVRTIIENGGKLGVSSRGSGNVDDRGHVSDFEIITVDIVAKPSAQNAYPKPVFEAMNSRRGVIIEDLAKVVSQDPKAQKYLAKELLTWIDNLKA